MKKIIILLFVLGIMGCGHLEYAQLKERYDANYNQLLQKVAQFSAEEKQFENERAFFLKARTDNQAAYLKEWVLRHNSLIDQSAVDSWNCLDAWQRELSQRLDKRRDELEKERQALELEISNLSNQAIEVAAAQNNIKWPHDLVVFPVELVTAVAKGLAEGTLEGLSEAVNPSGMAFTNDPTLSEFDQEYQNQQIINQQQQIYMQQQQIINQENQERARENRERANKNKSMGPGSMPSWYYKNGPGY